MRFKSSLKPTSALVDLTPLVDVVLLMLVFFLVTSDILPLKSLNISLPEIDLPALPQTKFSQARPKMQSEVVPQ
ncbi:MAG: hypothetical protein EBZ48_15735 [Proteobacteria bacterium]|nr:hypothetical protein [Pseudomonadota bacterium]